MSAKQKNPPVPNRHHVAAVERAVKNRQINLRLTSAVVLELEKIAAAEDRTVTYVVDQFVLFGLRVFQAYGTLLPLRIADPGVLFERLRLRAEAQADYETRRGDSRNNNRDKISA